MAIVIRYMCCLVFISRSSDLIQYGGIVTKAKRFLKLLHTVKKNIVIYADSHITC